MVCSPTNAYPNNNCVDGNNFNMRITFNGDYTIGVHFFIYDYINENVVKSWSDYGASTKGYCNGEEIKSTNISNLAQNKEYVWRAKFFEKVDIDNGYYPDVYSSEGTVQKNPITKITVIKSNYIISDDRFITIESNLDITVPCYVYVKNTEDEFERRLVTNYHKTKGVIKLDSAYDTKPEEGTEMYLSTIKFTSSRLKTLISKTAILPIKKGLNIDTGSHWCGDYDSAGEGRYIHNTFIVINDIYYEIDYYDYQTGLLSTGDNTPVVEEGTAYQIYQSFVISPYYYFTTKPIPTITPKMTFVNEVIKCEASIDTAGNYPVKYFYWSIYKDDVLVNQSEKIWSGRLEYIFRELESNATYTGKITVVTQDNIEITSDFANCTIWAGVVGITNLTASLDNSKNSVILTWENVAGVVPTGYMILRKDSANNIQYLETIQQKSLTKYVDYSCGCNKTYQYIVVPKMVDMIYQQATVSITTKFDSWAIYFLTEVPYSRPSESITDVKIYYDYMYGDKQFKVTDRWKIELEPKVDNIAQILKRNKNDVYRGKPTITYGNMNYDSFKLSFVLGNLSCWDNDLINTDYQTLQKWKTEVGSNHNVLIKDTNGAVWFGAITEHSYTPDYSSGNYQLYTIDIDFVQTRDMCNTRILTD